MNAPDERRKTTTNQTVEHNSAFNGHAGTTLIKSRETLPKKGSMETLTVTSVARATPLEAIQNQGQKEGRRSNYWTEVTHADSINIQTLQTRGERFSTDLRSMRPGRKTQGQTSLLQTLS
jgi:hypothetical protein